MKCFIIMPYAEAFDDPLASIRRAVESVTQPVSVTAIRLDDHRVAGRITQRLERALRESDLCVADISPSDPRHPGHANPNVMWEIGFAMALGKMPILVSHGDFPLPFDLQDVTHIRYDRAKLGRTLEQPLTRAVQDTVHHLHAAGASRPAQGATSAEHAKEMAHAVVQILASRPDFSALLRQVNGPVQPAPSISPSDLVGCWVEEVSRSHAYVADIHGQLVAPYCYSGNEELSGIYYDWRPVNDLYYARFRWRHDAIEGFSFLRASSRDLLTGAWWYEGSAMNDPSNAPDPSSGYTSSWRRRPGAVPPKWALDTIEELRTKGIEKVVRSFALGQ